MPKDYSDGDNCVVKCSADIAVDLGAKPEVTCEEVGRNGTSFGIAFKTKVNPRCQIKYKGSKQNSCDPCEHTCYFTVDLDADCETKVVNTNCGKTKIDYKMNVKIPVKSHCEVKNVCKDDKKPVHKPKVERKHSKDHGMAAAKLSDSNNKLNANKSSNYVQQLSREYASKSEKTIRA